MTWVSREAESAYREGTIDVSAVTGTFDVAENEILVEMTF